MKQRFKDRRDAGEFLAKKLKAYENRPDVLILALPRGGVPVGYEIATALNISFDIFIVRKLGAPIYEELAMGAIASGGVRVLNDRIIQQLGITPQMIEAVVVEQQAELERRERRYRRDRPPIEIENKIVILVDDGLATGASMRAAVRALKQRHPAKIVVAVPVGAADTCNEFESEADEVICGHAPEDFGAVGAWYDDFTQTTDEEVCELLNRLAHQQKVQNLLVRNPDRYHDVITHNG